MLSAPDSARTLSRVHIKPTKRYQERLMRQTTQLLAAAASLLLAFSTLAADSPPFPRLAGVNNGSPHNYDETAYQQKLAKLNFSVLNTWVGWDKTYGMTMEQVVRNIKAINPNTRVFLYENSMEVREGDGSQQEIYQKVDQMKWFAFQSGGDGDVMLSPFGARTGKAVHLVNNTLFTPRDSSGYQAWEWHARWAVKNLFKPNPS